MASNAIITFKAGQCELDGKKVKPDPTPGYIYMYEEDELLHFCWRTRSAAPTSPDLDLIMFPGDAAFTPYTGTQSSSTQDVKSPTNGRIFMLKFASSSQRHFFWLQSKSQHPQGESSWFSTRDKHLGEIVNQLLTGDEVDVEAELQRLREGGDDDQDGDGDGDDAMEDVQDQQPEHHRQGSGGAGADATGADPRDEGEASREGGADGGRAPSSSGPNDASDAVQNFLRSLQGSSSSQQPQQQQQQSYDRPFTTLSELLSTNTTIPFLANASPAQIDALCAYLPPSLFLLAQESAATTSSAEPSPETARAAIEAMAVDQKRDLLQRVLRSPQLHQSLGSLTFALRDGGLPMISEALGVKVQNGGFVKGASVPLGGGEAVEAFVEGVKRGVEGEKKG